MTCNLAAVSPQQHATWLNAVLLHFLHSRSQLLRGRQRLELDHFDDDPVDAVVHPHHLLRLAVACPHDGLDAGGRSAQIQLVAGLVHTTSCGLPSLAHMTDLTREDALRRSSSSLYSSPIQYPATRSSRGPRPVLNSERWSF